MAEICVEMMFNIYKKYLPNEIVFIESEMNLLAYENARFLYFEDGDWYPIERVNKKTITVKSKTGDYNFTIDKSFIKQIEN